jgi:hypothetical protein
VGAAQRGQDRRRGRRVLEQLGHVVGSAAAIGAMVTHDIEGVEGS